MSAYFVKRLLLLLPVLFGVSLVVFGVMSLVPGDPALAILGPYATPERLAELRAELGLDRSWPVRYGRCRVPARSAWAADRLLNAPAHPYTAALLACSPELGQPEKPLAAIPGQPPSPAEASLGEVVEGCRFAPRCPNTQPRCREQEPGLERQADQHWVRCWFPLPAGQQKSAGSVERLEQGRRA